MFFFFVLKQSCQLQNNTERERDHHRRMSLQQLRQAVRNSEPITLLDAQNNKTNDITNATLLSIKDTKLPLDSETDFIVNDKPVSLRVIVYCWLNKDLSATQLLNDSTEKKIDALSFLQRNDLVNYLTGNEESQFVKSESEVTASTEGGEEQDPLLKKILDNERDLLDHNSALRGFKSVDFYNVGRECEIKIIKQLKRNKAAVAKPEAKKQKGHSINPIILISPAASALLSLSNIKAFLQDSIYIDPNTTDPELQQQLSDPTSLRHIDHVFSNLNNRKVTFLVVNNTDRFTRPEYWDRVVAIFTTGQEWQFKGYKWTNPKELFQRIKGFYFHYKGDNVPSNVKDWNVEKIAIDKVKRFKDSEVLNYFWDEVEKSLVQRGF